MRPRFFSLHSSAGLWTVCFLLVGVILLLALYFKVRLKEALTGNRKIRRQSIDEKAAAHLNRMNSRLLGWLLQIKKTTKIKIWLLTALSAECGN